MSISSDLVVDHEEDDAPCTEVRACTGCFDEAARGSKCWKCGNRLCGKPPCARQANGDTFCELCWPEAIEAALEAAEADRTRFHNALVRIAAGQSRAIAARVLAGHAVEEPTQELRLAAMDAANQTGVDPLKMRPIRPTATKGMQ